MKTTEFDRLLADWATRHALSPGESARIYQAVIQAETRPAGDLSPQWWRQVFAPVPIALRHSARIGRYLSYLPA